MATALTITDEQTEFTPQQRQALQALGIGAVTPGDLQIFFATCQQTGLNPFLKQIYFIRRGDKSTIQVGIDGLLIIADRITAKTGEAYGISPILWCGGDGVWRDVWLPATPPAAAKVTVKRRQETFTAVALFREFAPMYNGRLSGLWAKMPAHMIGKVAMAHALRRAFPAEMSSVYTDDEMEQAGPVQTAPVQAQPVQQQPKQTAPVQVRQPRQAAHIPYEPFAYDSDGLDYPYEAPYQNQQPRQQTPAPAQVKQPQQPKQTAPKPELSEAQWAEQMRKKAQAATPAPAKPAVQPAQPVTAPAQATPAPAEGAHWQTHRVDPWAMPAPATTPAADTADNDWRRNVPQAAQAKQATKPAQPAPQPAAAKAAATTNAKEGTK